MKKIINILSVILIITSIGVYAKNYNNPIETVYNYHDVKNSLIRFHVLANSDNKEDQNLKLKVKDEVINYLYSYLKDSKSLEESRNILKEQEDYVKEIANKVIKENGFNYSIKTELGYENFPEKSYGSIVLPQGKYEAFRIIIGNGKGHNWWCVMFPPLCFVDEQKGIIDKDTDDKLREVLTEEEYELISQKTSKQVDRVQIKFKIVEIIQDIIK